MVKDPNQAIYDETFKQSLQLGYMTFNYLPDSDAPYPFVYFGEQFEEPIEVKSNSLLIGTTNITIHVYTERQNRKQLTDIMANFIEVAKQINTADVYKVSYSRNHKQIIQDTTTATTLWHGILEIEFNYSNY